MRNVEIKARVRNLAALLERVRALSDTPCETIYQNDTFYDIPNGRLKLRKYEDESSELVYYERDDTEGPKLSSYDKVYIPCGNTDQLNKVLCRALGEKGIVKKKRQLFMYGQTRIHIDSVTGLGDFMELEVMLRDFETPSDGETIAHSLMQQLGVESSDLVAGAYRDLLEQQEATK